MRLFHVVGDLFVPVDSKERAVDCPQNGNLEGTARFNTVTVNPIVERQEEKKYCYDSGCEKVDCPFYKTSE
jgi:hypothetical protein